MIEEDYHGAEEDGPDSEEVAGVHSQAGDEEGETQENDEPQEEGQNPAREFDDRDVSEEVLQGGDCQIDRSDDDGQYQVVEDPVDAQRIFHCEPLEEGCDGDEQPVGDEVGDLA